MITGSEAALENAINSDRLPHAILLVGDSYMCLHAVRSAATKLLQQSEAELDIYPDFYCLEGQKMTADEGGTVDIIISELQKAPFGRKRIWHIKNAGMMSEMVQNKLLKTIEEPAPDNVFFLTGMVDFLLPTILSRCMRLTLSTPTVEEAAAYVQEAVAKLAVHVSSDEAGKSAKLAEYDIAEAIELAKGGEYAEFFACAVGYICSMKKKCMVCDTIDGFVKTRETALTALRIFSRCVSDMLHKKLGLQMTVFSGSKFESEVALCAERMSEKSLLAVSEHIGKAYSDIFSNSSAKQVLTHLAALIEQTIQKNN